MKSYSRRHDEKVNYNNKDPFDVVANMASRLLSLEIGLHFF